MKQTSLKRLPQIVFAAAIAAVLVAPPLISREAAAQEATPDPLAPFDRLVGGQWHLDGSYQEFEWGVGRRSVKARSYFVVEGEPRLVSEGVWFWHPGEQQIKGIFTAVDMPVDFFDYTTRFEGATMINDLRTFGPAGEETLYLETWEFVDDAHFVWTLLRRTPEGLQEEMGGTYTRK